MGHPMALCLSVTPAKKLKGSGGLDLARSLKGKAEPELLQLYTSIPHFDTFTCWMGTLGMMTFLWKNLF